MKKVKRKKSASTQENTPDDLYNQKGRRTMKIRELKINKGYKGLIPRPSKEDKGALRMDIKKNGIEIPIIINKKHVVIDGHTRIEIAEGLGFLEVPVEVRKFKDKREETYFIIQVNSFRRHYTTAQRVEIGLKLLEFEKEKAKERQREHSKTAPGKTKTVVGPEPTSVPGKARDIVARRTGLSSKTLQCGVKINNAINTLEDKAKADVLEGDWNEALAGKKSVKSVYQRAIGFEEEESDKPKKNPSMDKIKVKRLSDIKYKIDTIRAEDIIAIENEKDMDIAIQTIEKMIAHLKEQLEKIRSKKTRENNLTGITKELQEMEKKKEAEKKSNAVEP